MELRTYTRLPASSVGVTGAERCLFFLASAAISFADIPIANVHSGEGTATCQLACIIWDDMSRKMYALSIRLAYDRI